MTWEVVRHRETAAEFHARAMPDPAARAVWVCEATSPALVLGSTQDPAVVDQDACARAGIAVVRRRSGGGAVLVLPGDLLWIDVVLPSSDALWRSDVGAAFHWLGEAWSAALGELGVPAVVHRRGLQRSAWSDLVCFAGLGPGEVTTPSGTKLVGISQRRTRAAARFQCAALGAWDPTGLVELLALSPEQRVGAVAALAGAATGVGVALDALLDAFLHRLP